MVLGVDLDEFRPNPSEDGYSPKETIRACYVGRMSHEKYPQLAVATLIELHRRGVPIELHMYGTGPDVEALKRQGDGYPVIFHGFVDGRAAVAQCYRESDLTFSMCPTETFGLAPLESLACGTPAVVVNGSGASETVDHSSGESAQADPCSLAEAVTRLISRLSPQLRRAARARAEHFPWSASVEKMLEIHQRLTESR